MNAAPLRHPALRALALILLGCYSFVFFQSQVLHPLAHHSHDHELHSQEAEADLCHQVIYHQSAQSCGHSTHLEAEIVDCELCDFMLIPQEVDKDRIKIKTPTKVVSESNSLYLGIALQANQAVQSIRGPPVLA